MSIGNRITELRRKLQLSQEELADKIGVTRQSVSKWETDVSAPDAFNLIALSEILDTSVEYIVTGKTNTKEKTENAPCNNKPRSNLSILGFLLVGGGILMAIIGMFLHEIWSIIGAFVVATGFICPLVKKKKTFLLMFSIMTVLIAVTVILLTV